MLRYICLKIAFVASVLFYSGISAGAAPIEKMLVLEQKANAYGPMIVHVQKNGVRMDTLDHEKSFLCAAPTWDAYIFNNKRKLLYRRPFAVWSKDGVETALSLEWNDFHIKAVPVAQITYAGVKASEYAFPSSRNGVDDIRFGKIADYLTTNQIETDAKITKFMSSLFDVPIRNNGFLLRFRRIAGRSYGFGLKYNREQYVETCLDTAKSSFAPLDAKLFVPPQHYKTSSDAAIFVDAKDSDAAYSELMGH